MALFFWEFDNQNDIEREWAMFAINFLAVIFTSYCLIKTARFHGKVLFELLPLSINTIATIILLFIKLFEKGYEFDLVGYVIEIFTYFLFCYTFSILHVRILNTNRLPLKKVCNGLLLMLATVVVIVMILVMTEIISKDCDNNLTEGSIVCLATEIISYIPTVYFGFDILKKMDKKDREDKQRSDSDFSQGVFQIISDRYIRERKNQIKMVLGAFTISLVLRGLVLGFNLDFDSFFTCTSVEDVFILTSDQFLGQMVLVLIEINQLIPHLIIPIALFVIPVGKHKKSSRIDLQQTLLQEEQDYDDHGDQVQRRISRSIATRTSQQHHSIKSPPSSPTRRPNNQSASKHSDN